MQWHVPCVLVFAWFLLAGCQSKSPDAPSKLATPTSAGAIAKDQVLALNELAGILEGITDVAGLKAATPRIKVLWARLQADEKAMKALPASTEQKAEFEKEHAAVTAAVQRLFNAVIAKHTKMPGASAILEEQGVMVSSVAGGMQMVKVYDVTRPGEK